MSFIWPLMLITVLLVPLLVVLYVRLQRRRQRMATSYGSLGLVQQARGGQFRFRRHIPPVFFLVGLTLLTVALARPQSVVTVPKVAGTVVLTFDVSGSMAADDIKPTRMEAAKEAARKFVEEQPSTVMIGVVAFSDSGLSVQVPTNDQGAIMAAINRLAPTRGTSLANGINAALKTIATAGQEQTRYYTSATPTPMPSPTPVPPGTFTPAVIVLLTDGENTVSPDPLEAAQLAVDRGVRVNTVGIGSPEGTTLHVEGFTVHTQLDEATLKQISDMTDGTYYNAQSEQDLQAIYQKIGSKLVMKSEKTELTSIFAAVSLLVLLIGGALSLFWFSRLP